MFSQNILFNMFVLNKTVLPPNDSFLMVFKPISVFEKYFKFFFLESMSFVIVYSMYINEKYKFIVANNSENIYYITKF